MLFETVIVYCVPVFLVGMTTAALKFPARYPQLLSMALTLPALLLAGVITYDAGQLNMMSEMRRLVPIEQFNEVDAMRDARFKLESSWLFVAGFVAAYLIVIRDLHKILGTTE